MTENKENPDIVTDLFSLGLKALIKEKSCTLNQLRVLELELIKAKHLLADRERYFLLNTNFEKKGLTNEQLRKAYVEDKTRNQSNAVDIKENAIKAKKDELEIIKDLMKFIELAMKGD